MNEKAYHYHDDMQMIIYQTPQQNNTISLQHVHHFLKKRKTVIEIKHSQNLNLPEVLRSPSTKVSNESATASEVTLGLVGGVGWAETHAWYTRSHSSTTWERCG